MCLLSRTRACFRSELAARLTPRGMCFQLVTAITVSIIFFAMPTCNTLSWKQFKQHWVSLVALALLYTISVSCNNASLSHVSLSTKYLISDVTPIPTIVLSYYIEKKGYNIIVICIVSLQVICSLLAVPQDGTSASAYGVVLAILSVIAASGKPVLAAVLMRGRMQTGLTPLALISAVFTALLTLLSDDERTHLYIELRSQAQRSCVVIIVGSLLASAYNILMFYLTLVTSALTNTVLGNVKQVRTLLQRNTSAMTTAANTAWLLHVIVIMIACIMPTPGYPVPGLAPLNWVGVAGVFLVTSM
ncbi:MAG: hypothetical protein SGPRY_000346 [Prymnesium sp.]